MPEKPEKSRPYPGGTKRKPATWLLPHSGSSDIPSQRDRRVEPGVTNSRDDDDAPLPRRPTCKTQTAYAELQCTSNYTFLTGASHPDELVQQAAALGHEAIAITDVNTLAGIVRAHVAAKDAGIQLVVGCHLRLQDPSALAGRIAGRRYADNAISTGNTADETLGPWVPPLESSVDRRDPRETVHELSVLVYPTDRASYGRLCRLLTVGKRRAGKGHCHLTLHDLIEHHEGMLAAVVPPRTIDQNFIDILQGLRRVFDDDRLSLVAARRFASDDHERLLQLRNLAAHTQVPLLAANDVLYHHPSRQPLQDIVTCIRAGCRIDQAGFLLEANRERHLKSAADMATCFHDCPQAIARSVDIATRTQGFNLDQLRYNYPHEVCPAGLSPIEHLKNLTDEGAKKAYPNGVPEKVQKQIDHEMALIDELNYAPYFLTVHDLVVFARSRDILCQGRGAAANSAVCYCLGVTAVDPDQIDVLFERFVSRQRNEPPDIDIDFEHERREEVIQYLYQKYGRDRAALTAVVITYRHRSAVREVGKALGLSLDCVDRLAKDLAWWEAADLDRPEAWQAMGLNANDPTMSRFASLCRQLLGFPRHLSQHVGGFVISQDALCEVVPIANAAMEDRTVIEWDKDDIDALNMIKVDVLALGMMSAIAKCFEMLNKDAKPQAAPLELHTIPQDDAAVYDMVCEADTIGVFQIESRAQMSMLPRMKPRSYYDLVIEVSLVRPGPIQGDMVHPYLRRRNGEEQVVYPNETIRKVLGRTLGVPLFQEQAMQLAIVAAGFTPEQADQLRRAIAAWKTRGHVIQEFGTQLVGGMVANGYDRDFAERCFNQIKGFSEYGFPESHAASFALLVYVSAWLKRHHPAAFCASVVNSQPMGFYAPAQLVRDAREHGVTILPIDVNHSQWNCTLEAAANGDNPQLGIDAENPLSARMANWRTFGRGGPAVRLGMRLVKGLREADANAIASAAGEYGCMKSIQRLWRASGVRAESLRKLAQADAYRSMSLDRQAALWHVRELHDEQLPLFDMFEDEQLNAGRRKHTTSADLSPEAQTQLAIAQASQAGNSQDETVEYSVPELPEIEEPRQVVFDYRATGLSLRQHPMSFIRRQLDAQGIACNAELHDEKRWQNGKWITVAGIVLIRQRPGTAQGIIFETIEDETGVANLILKPDIYERYRKAALHSRAIEAYGKVERQGLVVHVMVYRLRDIGSRLEGLSARSRDFH